MTTFVIQEPIKLEFVINFAKHDVSVVFSIHGTLRDLLIGTNLDRKVIIFRHFLFHLFGNLGEVLNGVWVHLFQLIEVADGWMVLLLALPNSSLEP